MLKFIKKIPIAICGLALALAGLGNLLSSHGVIIKSLCGSLSGLILLLVLGRFLLDKKAFMEELNNPIGLGLFPSFSMALVLLSTYIRPYGQLSIFFWYGGLFIHLGILLIFIKKYVLNFKLENVFPSYFVVFVGHVVLSLSASSMNRPLIGEISFYLGLTSYIIILPLLTYRLRKIKILKEGIRPTLAIFTAPMSLLLAAYLSSFKSINTNLIFVMVSICLLSYIFVCIKMFDLLKLKFYPSFAAFTFPFVISGLAFKLTSNYLSLLGYNYLKPLALISQGLAVFIVIYVFFSYIKFLFVKEEKEVLLSNTTN